MGKKMSPAKRPIAEMLERYAKMNNLPLEEVRYFADITNMRFFHEMEKSLVPDTLVFGQIPYWEGVVHIMVDFSTSTSRAFTETLRMLQEMAAVKVKQEYSNDKGIKYTLYRKKK